MTFAARYESQCSDCGERIHMGDLIVRDGENFVHEDCEAAYVPATEFDRDAQREVCTSCFILKPCPCQDGV